MGYLSLRFAAFFILLLFAYHLVPRKLRKWLLLGSSLIFYASYDVRCLVHLLLLSSSAFLAAKAISEKRHARVILISCVALHAALWFCIKDLAWLVNSLLNRLNSPHSSFVLPGFLQLVPIGLSYYTLQSISYVVDVYRGKTECETRFSNYLLFLSYFPAIVQGPISRYSDLGPQLDNRKAIHFEQVLSGITLMLWGTVKKMVVADRLALIANHCFSGYADLRGLTLYIGALSFAFQLYMDFSGCVDMCRGVSRCFGIELAENFNSPYASMSIKEFWTRWHLTLSRWLRDYIYIPLGGNRKGTLRKYFNLTITFLVSGLWHGAGLNYLAWGGFQALCQILGETTFRLRTRIKHTLGVVPDSFSDRFYRILITFHLTLFSWILFRSARISDAFAYIRNMLSGFNPLSVFDVAWFPEGVTPIAMFLIVTHLVLILTLEKRLRSADGVCAVIRGAHLFLRWFIYILLIFDIFLFGVYGSGYSAASFLYGGF